ncbi:MAG: Membrane protein-like protein [Methanoculleus marisnigri]|uniref:Membrane protein-like protein n=1 Tax=Methanoculleus marisnigri TaxID=2198 RepID=A0A117LQ25_9EURY|nr:MAG: Membrane protein-like protein [Methanoculleus marisnigri]
MTITLHIAWSLMVLASVVYGRKALLALAVLWHAAVYLAPTQGVLVTEAVIFVFAVIGLAYILWEWRRMGVRAAS